MHKGPLPLIRAGRRLLWSHPALYRVFGVARSRGDCFSRDYDLWIDGYPRSANTFAVKAFQMANPQARIRSHRHIPTFIIKSLAFQKPGIFLLRKPEDAAVSWAIFWNESPAHCLDYYLDFHRVLLPRLPELFVATFETVTSDFGTVISQFNRRFGARFQSISHEPRMVSQCFALIDNGQQASEATLEEMRVSRPSSERARIKAGLVRQLRNSPDLIRKLDRARELYDAFHPGCEADGSATLAGVARQAQKDAGTEPGFGKGIRPDTAN